MKTLKFKGRDELIQVNPDEVVCFRADGNYSTMVLCSRQEQLLSMNLSKLQSTLDEQLGFDSAVFERIGRDLILRKSYIFSLQVLQQKITLITPNGNKFIEEVSRDAIKKLKERQETDTTRVKQEVQLRDLLTGKIYLLKTGLNRFGRKSSSTKVEHPIENGDTKISRNHFCIEMHFNAEERRNEYHFSDSQSANGTFLDGKLIDKESSVLICLGTKIKVGNTEFIFEKIDTDKTEIY